MNDMITDKIERVVLLWVFGMMCQGNLPALDPVRIFFFSNTLKAIAVGYLFPAISVQHRTVFGKLLFILWLMYRKGKFLKV